jgi:hypothetical protein
MPLQTYKMCKFLSEITLPYNGNVVGMLLITFHMAFRCESWSWCFLSSELSIFIDSKGASWSWSYGSWIYSDLYNQYLSPLTLCTGIPPRRGVLDATLCDKVCQWFVTVRWFSPDTFVSSTNKTDRLDITKILLKCGSCVIVVINEKQKYNIIRT